MDNRGPRAFEVLWQRLFKIDAHRNFRDKYFIRENAWHIATILNTFNSHYCYDVHYSYIKEISPIYIRFAYKDVVDTRRLLSVEIALDKTNNPLRDAFIFYFDDGVDQIIPLSFAVANSLFGGEKYREYQVVIPNDAAYKDVFIACNKIAPFNCDVWLDYDTSKCETVNEYFTNLHVNLRYVRENRISPAESSSPNCTFDANIFENVNDVDKKTLITYLYGLDLAYMDVNFDADNEYKPKQRIEWSTRLTEVFLKLSVDHNVLYLPKDKALTQLQARREQTIVKLLTSLLDEKARILSFLTSVITRTNHTLKSIINTIPKSFTLGVNNNGGNDEAGNLLDKALQKQQTDNVIAVTREELDQRIDEYDYYTDLCMVIIDEVTFEVELMIKDLNNS